ncbi:hypothetical protein BU16DRAFT_577997 [Lophium mytilinum]|uniref:Uncharacterized protein n=1 Tax=Lophium mytilinum TaxID=390894 RepID=A0A6A6R885_9PEZI|nr:hypothetical protein BU16DRAFT_577997 [Lophium mytilinum]
MPAVPSEADVVYNRMAVVHAKHQKLIASWLPPKTPEELANAKSEEELEREEKAIFAPVPEVLGVGAPIPKDVADGSFKRKNLSSNDKLLTQLLGNKAAKAHLKSKQTSKHAVPTQKPASKPVKGPSRQDDSEDEEEGRSSMFKSKRHKSSKISPEDDTDHDADSRKKDFVKSSNPDQPIKLPSSHSSTTTSTSKKRTRDADHDGSSDSSEETRKGTGTKKRSPPKREGKQDKKHTNYLDEVLSERKKKKKKKNKDLET